MNSLRLGLVAALTLTVSSIATAETACTAPTAPTVSPSFANQAEADAMDAAVEAYLTASGLYQKCLEDERAAYGEAITETQDAELTALRTAAKNEAKATAIAYNNAVVAFLGN